MKTVALNEFKSLQENDIFSIAKVEWWLLKYENYFKKLKPYWCCPNKGCNMRIGLTCICKNKHDELLFLELFKELDALSLYYRKEEYFKQEMATYHEVKDCQVKLKDLIIRNENIGVDGFLDFLIYYQNYCANPIHLKVLDKTLLGYEVFVDRKDFSNNIEFLNIFSKLFWKDEIFPESEIIIEAGRLLNENRPENLSDFK
jgi:hypothetical protein